MLLTLTEEEKAKLHALAKEAIGIEYQFGAEVDGKVAIKDVKAIDCSELVEFLFYKLGYKVPDGSIYQFNASAPVDTLEVGDLVFKQKDGCINHVGVIVSADSPIVLEANGWKKVHKVCLTLFDKFSHPFPTAAQYAGARRFLAEKVQKVV